MPKKNQESLIAKVVDSELVQSELSSDDCRRIKYAADCIVEGDHEAAREVLNDSAENQYDNTELKTTATVEVKASAEVHA